METQPMMNPLTNPNPTSYFKSDSHYKGADPMSQHSKELAADWTTFNVYVSETNVSTRIAFLRRVYGTLLAQLFLTMIMVIAVTTIPALQTFFLGNVWLPLVSILGSFGLLIALHLKKDCFPTNLYLLAAWTTCLSILLSQAVAVVPAVIVLQATILTFGLVLGLTLYTLISKKDFSFLGASLYSALWLLILVGFLRFLLPTGDVFQLLYSAAGAFLFCLFILYDTSNILHRYSIDDWVPAVITLYLDIVNLFLHILDLLRRRS